ncbi:anaphase-promoting complex, cyclosome, subunit 4-domain-containing protein [Syncephalastrum racemosum]|uniref:Anaphase-promoting complex subunit 4 n=1 Tax=Syncephalastrum racemosum TaxID=13706 RepID=A0A1X2HN62_SYNRA|nr:anaphase-promoting complex, cyclosome, subunit 4-domain-containing protein [Syncephalastrum racemosum]
MSATADTSTGSKSKRQRTGHKSEAKTAREEAASVVSVSTDANADILRVLLRRESSTDNAPSYTLKILSNPVLKNRKEEICNIAASQMQINYLLNYMGYCFRLLERHHRTVLSMANQNAEKITSSIINHDEEGTAMPELEMIGFLALGRACDAVEEYFSEKVSERQVRMWQTRTAHSYMTCRTIASAYLLPACDRLMVYLDYWKGCSMHIQKYAGLLSMDEVCQSIHSAKTLSKRLHSYLAEVTKASKLFDEFILWVIHTTQKYADKKETGRSEMEQPHLENEKPIFTNTPWPIIDYLNSYFASDGMAHFFDDPPDAPRTEASLRKMFNNLKDTCTKTMTQPAAIVTQNTTVIGSIDIPIRAAPQQPNTFGRDMVAWAPDEDLQMYAFTKRDPLDETLTLVRMAGADIIEGVQIDLSGIRIHDMEFFDQNNLGVVYSTAQDDDSSTIATMDLGSYAYSKLSSMKMAKNERAKVWIEEEGAF